MKRTCVICGSDIDEGVAVCPKCGMQNPTELPEFQTISKPTASPKKKSKVLPFILGGAAVVIVAVAVLLLNLFGNAPDIPTEPPSVLSTLWENSLTLANGNFDNFEAMAPNRYWEWLAEQRHKTKETLLQGIKADNALQYKWNNPSGDIVYTGKIISEIDIDDQLLEEISDVLFSSYEIPESSVTAGKKVTLQRRKISSDNTIVLPEQTLFAVKIDDSWYFIRYDEFINGTGAYFFFY
ncbi:MAG: zinc ribbon domain-containing protein [Oscillospiraceae bacterium]|nr:zinc ribbon domain-containing protein [Oscillospiraceae bacterium]